LFLDTGHSLGQRGQKICLVDLDHNNTTDAITTHMEDGNQNRLNDGTGIFAASAQCLDAQNVISICAGDVNVDGKLDGSGENKLYFSLTNVLTWSSSWRRIKTLFEREQQLLILHPNYSENHFTTLTRNTSCGCSSKRAFMSLL